MDTLAETPSEQEQLFHGIVALRATMVTWVGFCERSKSTPHEIFL
jgi:hypothetical protein